MSPTATFHAQLASIMEVLANTAVAEICELVGSGYAVLQLEISRSRKENEVLRRKLRLMELRAVRTAALRAATGGGGLLHASSRPRVHLFGGYDQRRPATPTENRADDTVTVQSRSSNQETPRFRDPSPPSDSGQETTSQTLSAGETTPVIKVEDENESWSPTEPDKTEASSSLIKREEEDDEDGGSLSWTSGEVSSTSTQHALNTSQRPETSAYDSVMFELQHSSHTSQNLVGVEPSGSSALTPSGNISADSGTCFSFSHSELSPPASEQPAGFHNQQRAPAGVQSAFVMRDGCLVEDRIRRTDSGGRTFVCNCCGKTLACLKNLKTHMRVHTGEKPFVCALCGKRFSDSSNLKRHQSVHTGEKRYGCVHCGKRFAQSGSLKVHMSVHRDCKQFRCSFCGKTFTSGGHLRRHIAAHTGEK